MNILEVIDLLEKAEKELKHLLASTPPTISITPKNRQDYISDALEEVQFSISCLYKAGQI